MGKEGSDYDSEILRLERPLKRRSIAIREFQKKPNWNAFTVLKNNQAKEVLVEYKNSVITSTSEHGDHENDDVDIDDHNQDLQYNMFLNNVKQHGESSAPVVSQKHGVPELLRHEIVDLGSDDDDDDDDDDDECAAVNQNGLRRLSNGKTMEIATGLPAFPSQGDVWSLRKLKDHGRNCRKREISDTLDDGVSRRRNHLAGRNAGRESSVRSGSEDDYLIEYESGREGDVDGVPSGERKSCLARRRAGKQCRDHEARETCRRSGTESNPLVDNEFNHEDGSFDAKENYLTSQFELKPDHEDENEDLHEYYRLVKDVHGGTNGRSSTRPRSEGSQSVEREGDQEDFSDDVDKDYMKFLGLLGKDAVATATYNIDDSPERFDEVEEIESDVEIVVMDKDPYSGATTPFVSSKQCIDMENQSLAEDPSVSCSQFKKGLMEVLKMPYDSQEHEDLKDEVSHRKPILKVRVLRSSTKSYPVEHKLGKSYLDSYSDFAKKLDQAKNDDRKSLNLLRGFFYWLKNVTLDKGFKPWLDPSCLTVLPQK